MPKYIRCPYLILFILGDVQEALNKVKQHVTSDSAFFNAFLEEGLRLSSSVYLCLIWIRVLKHVFQNPNEAVEHLKSHHFHKNIVSRPSTDAYLDGLWDFLQCIRIGSPIKRSAGGKCTLSDILLDESDSYNEDKRTTNIKRSNIV